MLYNEEELDDMIRRYLAGTASPEERKRVESWYQTVNEKTIEIPMESEKEVITTEARILDQLRSRMAARIPPVHRIHFLRRYGWWAAASVLLLLSASIYFTRPTGKRPITAAPDTRPGQAVAYIRNITLPDGSTVVLQANSKLDYPPNFDGHAREVNLSGEAYFNITHNETAPFIIHTGKLKTTVLGTAFNIRAYAGQPDVVVSVTHGRVRVEDEKKVLGELTPDQQMTYTLAREESAQQTVKAEKLVTDWTKQDMVFQRVAFSSVAETLQKRFGVKIQFTNPAVQHCLVRSSFDGTETLERVLNGLSKVQGITYTITDDKKVLIDGEGCQ